MRGWANAVSKHHGGGVLRSIEPFTGLRVTVLEGSGSREDPVRPVTHYFDEVGRRIMVNDLGLTGTMSADVDAAREVEERERRLGEQDGGT